MALFSFIIISLINSLFSLSQGNEYNSINKSNEFIPIKSFDAINDLSNITDDMWRIALKNILVIIKDYPESIYLVVDVLKDLPMIKNVTILRFICTDLLNKSNPILNETIKIIKNTSGSECIVDYLINILSKEKQTEVEISTNFKKIFNFPGFLNYSKLVYGRYVPHLFEILDLFPKKKNGKRTLVQLLIDLRPFFEKYRGSCFQLIFDLISHYKDSIKIICDIKKFILDTRTINLFLKDLSKIFSNKTWVEEIAEVIDFEDNVTNT